jgi:ankyrin repeat protein
LIQTYGSSPLHLAAEYNHFNIVDYLLKQKDININIMGKFTTLGTPLHIACAKGHLLIVSFLLDHNADLSLIDENGHTPLHIACMNDHYDIVHLLIEKHANPSILSVKKKTPIDLINNAIIKEKMRELAETMKRLKQEETNEIEKAKRIQIQRQLILSQQLTMIKQKEYEKQLLKEIRHNEFIKKLLLICDKSGDVNALVKLAEEYANDYFDINEPLLLSSYITNNPNYSNYQNPSIQPVSSSSQLPATGVSDHVTSTAVIPFASTDRHKPPSSYSNVAVTVMENDSSLSVASGNLTPRPNLLNPHGLHDIDNDDDDDSSINSLGLASNYSSILTSNKTHATALTLSALRGFYELVQGLLQWNGININIQELNGNTALHNAAMIGSRDICELLLLTGADNRIINKMGKTAANLTEKLSLQEIIRNPSLIATKSHLQNAIIKTIFEKKEKMKLFQQQQQQQQPSLLVNDDEEEKKNSLSLLSVESLSLHEEEEGREKEVEERKQNESTRKKEITVKDFLEEKKLLSRTKEYVLENSSKSHSSSLPIIANQFSNNIISQLHVKESNKLDIQQLISKSTTEKEDGTAPSSSSSVVALPLIGSPQKKPTKVMTGGDAKKTAMLVEKYGNIPESFGGNRSDFFNIKNYIVASCNKKEKESGFSDLFSLQKGYLPTAFDSMKEWYEMKDFLWLFGFPYRYQMIKIPIQSHSQQYQEHHQLHASAPYPSFYSSTGREQHLQEQEEDKRSLIYLISKDMNELQRFFIMSSNQIEFETEILFQSSLTSSTKSSFQQHLYDFIIFNNDCLLRQFSKESSEKKKHPHLHLLPRHIPSLSDFYKLILISNYCFSFISTLLAIFQYQRIEHHLKSYLQWAKEDYQHHYGVHSDDAVGGGSTDEGTKEANEGSGWHFRPQKPVKKGFDAESNHTRDDHCHSFYEYRCYVILQFEKEISSLPYEFPQLGLSSQFLSNLLQLLSYCSIQSFDSFLSFYNSLYPQQQYHDHYPQWKYETIGSSSEEQMKRKEKEKKRAEKERKEQEKEKQNNLGKKSGSEESKELLVTYGDDPNDSIKNLWSSLIVNPPRSFRNIIDTIYDLTSYLIPTILEKLYPSDIIRSHVWLLEANDFLEKMIEIEKEKFLREEVIKNKQHQQYQLKTSESKNHDGQNDIDDLSLNSESETFAKIPVLSSPLNSVRNEEKVASSSSIILTTPLQYWLFDLELLEYENYFLINGFKILEDFQELSQDDCYLYFPFLKVS